MDAASMMPLCQWVSNVRDSRGLEPIWILLAIDCQSLRIVHARMLYGPATAYAYGLAVHTPYSHTGLLSNYGSLRREGGKDVHVRYRLPPPLRSSILSLPLSLSLSLLSYPFMELKCTEERFYLVRVVRDINVHIQYIESGGAKSCLTDECNYCCLLLNTLHV